MTLTFRTKSGHVEVTRDALSIVRTGLRGAGARALQGDSKGRTLAVYALLCGLLVYAGVRDYMQGWVWLAVVLWSLAAWLVVMLFRARDFSMAPVLRREATERVEPVRGIPGLTRDRLVVHFRERDRKARRFILLPGRLQGGAGELERARALLTDHGWPLDP